jgi:hypothetical protein
LVDRRMGGDVEGFQIEEPIGLLERSDA